jgi:putative transcriptional regulator
MAVMERVAINDVEKDLVEGLGGFLEDLKNDVEIGEKYTCRGIILDLVPRVYTPAEVKATRKLLRISQTLFAKFLGVSPKTVRSWEQGKSPSDMASRFMDEIQRNPEYWRQRVAESAKTRPCSQ